MESTQLAPPIDLAVDLDGTLLKTDSLVESIIQLIKADIFNLLWMLGWLLRGKAYFKHEIAQRVTLNPEILPYNEKVLNFLRNEKNKGRRLILATASNEATANAIATHLGLFDDVIASNPNENLLGAHKAKALSNRMQSDFSYMGNSRSDLEVWKVAHEAIAVNASRDTMRRLQAMHRDPLVLSEQSSSHIIFKAMRVYQWPKNFLIFVPLVVSNCVDLEKWWYAAIAFLCFSLCASGIYLINDIYDIEADRKHPSKRFRPIPAGDMQLVDALFLALVLIGGALAGSWFISQTFMSIILVYLFITSLYSGLLKSVPIIDVAVLAGLFTLRIGAGWAATGIQLSFWLIAFSMFWFYSLALAKRAAEIKLLSEKTAKISGRGYLAEDFFTIIALGIASSFIAVTFVSLYIHSDEARQLYPFVQVLWLICAILIYWVSSFWLNVVRGNVSKDPVLWAISTKSNYLICFFALTVIYLAKFGIGIH